MFPEELISTHIFFGICAIVVLFIIWSVVPYTEATALIKTQKSFKKSRWVTFIL